MPQLSFVVEGKPIGKARARTVRRGAFIHSYTPKKTIDYEEKIRNAFIEKYPDHKPIEEKPITLEIAACFELPASYPKKIKEELEEKKFLPNTKKPDWDNIGKTISDALNGFAWKDDALIVNAKVVKLYYNDGARLIVLIKWED
jgi:Holliday junction resolvase RusA-like endonuclease